MPAESRRRFIIDTDTASDDAVAIIMAIQHPQVSVEALSIVSGNVPLPQASINARYTLTICDADIPVYEGCVGPMQRTAAHAEWFHGPDGMGDMNYPSPKFDARDEHAVDALIRHFSNSPQEIDLITLGPLTNIARVLEREPQFAEWVRHCYVMGGAACTVGNVTPAAEYNIWCDPEAARLVFHSGMPITMIGWELSRGNATLSDQEIQSIRAINTDRAHFAMDCNEHALRAVREIQGEAGLALADPVAMAVALDERVCPHRSDHFVDISCDTDLTRGMTVVDQLNVTHKPPNATVCWSLDSSYWKNMLLSALS